MGGATPYHQHYHRWSTSPSELIELILKRLHNGLDCIRFGAVCKSWRSVLLENQSRLTPLVTLLLLPTGKHGDPAGGELFDLTTNQLYKLPLLLETYNTSIVGSSHGWLVTMEYPTTSNLEIQLLNIITKARIPLPPATTFDNFYLLVYGFPLELFIRKAIIFSNPDSGNCVIMAIHGHRRELAFCRFGDQRWTSFGDTNKYLQYHDVIQHKGQFYSVTQNAIVVACVLDPIPKVVEVARLPSREIYYQKYLVNSSDELLMVVTRYMEDDNYRRTSKFAIDKLDLTTRKWEEVTDLDDRILFLGKGHSMSVSANEMCGCKPNSIYFVDDNPYDHMGINSGCHDMGVYDLATKTIQSYYSPSRLCQLPMFWVTLTP